MITSWTLDSLLVLCLLLASGRCTNSPSLMYKSRASQVSISTTLSPISSHIVTDVVHRFLLLAIRCTSHIFELPLLAICAATRNVRTIDFIVLESCQRLALHSSLDSNPYHSNDRRHHNMA
ncbi:hypothetical protein M405DRAFT_522906 [Rhizopogon salebrosus TDB-379]|nr:hypothetical protein M405DRAFT_522906 [Rhizopogon salebrosus TDB-379]